MEKSMPALIHDNVTSTKPKSIPKKLKFVGEGTRFGIAFFFESSVALGFVN
jgi:hypothetical protein